MASFVGAGREWCLKFGIQLRFQDDYPEILAVNRLQLAGEQVLLMECNWAVLTCDFIANWCLPPDRGLYFSPFCKPD